MVKITCLNTYKIEKQYETYYGSAAPDLEYIEIVKPKHKGKWTAKSYQKELMKLYTNYLELHKK